MSERTLEELRNALADVAHGFDGVELSPDEAATLIAALEPRKPAFEEGWYEVELMGHRRRVAHVRELEIAHRGFLDLRWKAGDVEQREIYSPSAVFCLTPLEDEAAAERLAAVDRDEIPF